MADQPQTDTTALISAKDETIAALRDQLEAERQAHAEAREIIAGLVERIPAIEVPSNEPAELPETVEHESEQQNRIEGNKLAAEAAKTTVLLSSGALVGMAALVGVLRQSHHTYWLIVAIVLISMSVLFSFLRMEELARSVAAQRPSQLSDRTSLGPALLVTGLVAFTFYVFYNVPFDNPSRLVRLNKEHVVWSSIILGILVPAIIAGVYALRDRVRRRSSDPEDAERAAPQSATLGAQGGVQKPWWKRILGRP